jgi:hypothetical protein
MDLLMDTSIESILISKTLLLKALTDRVPDVAKLSTAVEGYTFHLVAEIGLCFNDNRHSSISHRNSFDECPCRTWQRPGQIGTTRHVLPQCRRETRVKYSVSAT